MQAIDKLVEVTETRTQFINSNLVKVYTVHCICDCRIINIVMYINTIRCALCTLWLVSCRVCIKLMKLCFIKKALIL